MSELDHYEEMFQRLKDAAEGCSTKYAELMFNDAAQKINKAREAELGYFEDGALVRLRTGEAATVIKTTDKEPGDPDKTMYKVKVYPNGRQESYTTVVAGTDLKWDHEEYDGR